MPLDPRVQRFLAMVAAAETARPVATIQARRSGFIALMRQAGALSEAVPYEDRSVAGAEGPLPARLYAARGLEKPGPGLLYFHGGGFVSGDLDTHDGVCRQIAAASGCRILSVAYRLAPENPYPAAVQDALAAATALTRSPLAYGFEPHRIAVGGDSVGAGLAAIVAQAARQINEPRFAAQLLICPVLDAGPGGASRADFGKGFFLDLDTIARDQALYGLDRADASNPLVSPLRAPDLSGLSPAIIHTAEFDPVRDDGENYAARLDAAGVPVRLTRHPGMIHLFYGFGRLIPYATTALRTIGTELADALD